MEEPVKHSTEHDPIVLTVRTKVSKIKNSLASDQKTLPGAMLLADPTSQRGRSVKVTKKTIESAYGKLLTVTDGKKPSRQNIAVSVLAAMQIANEMLNTSKTYKVELALSIIRKLIDEKISDPLLNDVLHAVAESLIPGLLETIDDLPGFFSKYCCYSCKSSS